MPRLWSAIVLLTGAIALLGAGCELTRMKWGSDVTFDVDRETVRVGEPVEVRFSILKRDGGRRYFVAIAPEDTPLEDSSGRVEVPEGSRRVTVTPRAAGLNAVRVYVSPPEQPRYVAGRKVTVTP
jgi:uncharacterized protein (DUF58 family)